MDAKSNSDIDNLLSAVSAEDLRKFVRSYSLLNPSFLESLEEYFEDIAKMPATFDYNKAI